MYLVDTNVLSDLAAPVPRPDLADWLDRHSADLYLSAITAAEVVQTVELPQLDFSGRRFAHLTPPVFPYDLLGADGLLGLDVLSRFRLTLELRQRRVMMAPSGSDVVERGFSFGGVASRMRPEVTGTRSVWPLLRSITRVSWVPGVRSPSTP